MNRILVLLLLLASSLCGQASSSISVKSVSALKLLPPGAYASVDLLGYYAAGDGGGGAIYWSATSTATADSCTVFRPSSNPTRGRWLRRDQAELDVKQCGAKGDGSTNSTAYLKAAAATAKDLRFSEGYFLISDSISLMDSQSVYLSSNTTIRQTTADRNVFRAVNRTGVWINGSGAVLWGEGTYQGHVLNSDCVTANPDAWVGNSGHEDRGIQFLGCSKSGIRDVVLKRFGHSGIAIIGGSDIRISGVHIEGTHTHGTAHCAENNFQMGIFIQNNGSYGGGVKRLTVSHSNISGVTQGIVLEDNAYQAQNILFDALTIRDIYGQHGFYLQSGGVTISSSTLRNIVFAGVKVQSGGNLPHIKGVAIENLLVDSTGSQAVELGVTETGSISDFRVTGVFTRVQRGIAMAGDVNRGFIDIVVDSAIQYAVSMSNNDMGLGGATDIDMRVKGKRIGRDGINLSNKKASKIRIWPTLENVGFSDSADYSGVLVEGDSIQVDIFHPLITDSAHFAYAGIYNSNATCTVGVYGSATIIGYSAYGVRTASALAAWPQFYTISSTASGSAQFHDAAMTFTTGIPYGLANPSGTIGLTANNGTARTVPRSDGTPALSQAIIPTWSEMHTFAGGLLISGGSTGQGRLWKSTADGLVIQARDDGTDNDLALYSADNGTLLRNPAGTRDIKVGNGSANLDFPALTGTNNRLVQVDAANGRASASIQILTGTTTWDPANLAADGDATSTTVTVTGAAVEDIATATLSTIGANNILISVHIQAANTARVTVQNKTGGAIDLGSGTLLVRVLK